MWGAVGARRVQIGRSQRNTIRVRCEHCKFESRRVLKREVGSQDYKIRVLAFTLFRGNPAFTNGKVGCLYPSWLGNRGVDQSYLCSFSRLQMTSEIIHAFLAVRFWFTKSGIEYGWVCFEGKKTWPDSCSAHSWGSVLLDIEVPSLLFEICNISALKIVTWDAWLHCSLALLSCQSDLFHSIKEDWKKTTYII